MKIFLWCLVIAIPCALSAPGDEFEKCAKSCTTTSADFDRLNAWIMQQDTPMDKCTVRCCCTAYDLLEPSGVLKVDELVKIVPGVDVTMFGERNINTTGFMAAFTPFINKNRASLVMAFDHQEAASPPPAE